VSIRRVVAAEHDAPLVAIGADGAPRGWLLACLHADATNLGDATVWETRLELAADIDELALKRERSGGAPYVAIDVPIGLPDTVDYRTCDMQARDRLKNADRVLDRRPAVFAPPARYMLAAAGDYPRIRELVEREREHNAAANSLSAQAAGIVRNIKEVDDYVRAHADSEDWLFECHPELSFWALNEESHLVDKHRAAGVMRRLQLVRNAFPDAEAQLARAGWSRKEATLADMLDAYAALTTAIACVRGDQKELGDGERDSEGVLMRMVL
jgi:predicted RNase H-like nuclease